MCTALQQAFERGAQERFGSWPDSHPSVMGRNDRALFKYAIS